MTILLTSPPVARRALRLHGDVARNGGGLAARSFQSELDERAALSFSTGRRR
jgi:hypothetical protein